MLTYLIRRIFYTIPILIGVNIVTFILFFQVNSPDAMARNALGKNYNHEAGNDWKLLRNYNLPKFYNSKSLDIDLSDAKKTEQMKMDNFKEDNYPTNFFQRFTKTIFFKKNMTLFALKFGKSDQTETSIGKEICTRMPASLYITIPIFILPLFINTFIAMIVAFYRGSYIDYSALFSCVLIMSISMLFYIIGGQFLLANHLKMVPISGFDEGLNALKFIALPIIIGTIYSLGSGVRFYRTLFLEEINKDYVRTARSKGLGEGTVLFKHALKNALIPILTSVVVMIPFLIMGNLLLENFFAIPGIGSYTMSAIQSSDFAIMRSMVFLGSLLYIIALIAVDVSYTLVDPRIRLG